MKIHCDNCGRTLGTYLYGKGGVEEVAHIHGGGGINFPDVWCKDREACDEYRRRHPELQK